MWFLLRGGQKPTEKSEHKEISAAKTRLLSASHKFFLSLNFPNSALIQILHTWSLLLIQPRVWSFHQVELSTLHACFNHLQLLAQGSLFLSLSSSSLFKSSFLFYLSHDPSTYPQFFLIASMSVLLLVYFAFVSICSCTSIFS